MNLWVNRVRQLAVFAVALFFYSCTDEFNVLGHKNPNSKFDVKFIEIPLDSSAVFLSDSVFTDNNYGTGETNRLLVGVYDDPKFGRAKSIAFAQYYRTTSLSLIPTTAVYDSIKLFLQFDYYTYGSSGVTKEIFYIHELTDTLSNYKSYYNNSTIPYKSIPIATKDTLVSFTYFKDQASKTSGKDTLVMSTRLSDAFGNSIFDFAKNYTTDFLNDSTAKAFFKGFAIVPDDGNTKMVGFTPNGMAQGSNQTVAYTRMVLYYKDKPQDTVQKIINFGFNAFARSRSFNNIKIDRNSSPQLAGQPLYTPFVPSDDLLYSQSGDRVTTKINFGNFYDFVDTLQNNGHIIINSGELIFDGVQQESTLTPINSFAIRALDNNNKFKIFIPLSKDIQDSTDYVLYALNSINRTLDGQFNIIGDLGTTAVLQNSGNAYKTFITLFLQELANKESSKTRLRNFGLVPASPQQGKSVNRTLMNRNNIKLRIYYTLPTVKD